MADEPGLIRLYLARLGTTRLRSERRRDKPGTTQLDGHGHQRKQVICHTKGTKETKKCRFPFVDFLGQAGVRRLD